MYLKGRFYSHLPSKLVSVTAASKNPATRKQVLGYGSKRFKPTVPKAGFSSFPSLFYWKLQHNALPFEFWYAALESQQYLKSHQENLRRQCKWVAHAAVFIHILRHLVVDVRSRSSKSSTIVFSHHEIQIFFFQNQINIDKEADALCPISPFRKRKLF